MLNLRLKRMCARVIASLSALGVVSITDSSDAEAAGFDASKIYKLNDSFTYNRMSNLRFEGQYTSAAATCRIAGGNNIKSAEYISGGCFFTCNDGTYFLSGGGSIVTGFKVAGDEGTTIDSGTGVCKFYRGYCSPLANASTGYVGSDSAGWFCNWKCNDGYHVEGSDGLTSFTGQVPALSPGQVISPAKKCVGNIYTVTFDCKSHGKIQGTNSQATSVTGRYGSAFTFELGCDGATGYTFAGWKYASGS